jgi:enoyl-CoA hydratase
MIERRDEGAVTVLELRHKKANALDVELLTALDAELDAVQRAGRAVVITGSGPIFSAGVDLFRVLDGGEEYLRGFLPALDAALWRLFTFPRPAVAAVNGHAMAGGWILCCACDYRVMARGAGKVGLPELRVGVTFPPIVLETARFITPPATLQAMVFGGRHYDADAALQAGLVEETVPPDELLARALAVAQEMAAISPAAFRMTKEGVRQPFVERARAAASSAGEVHAQWAGADTAEVVRAYLARVLHKGGNA